MKVEVEYLHVVREWNEQSLSHGRLSQRCVLLELLFSDDQVIEVLLDEDSIDCHVVTEILFRLLHHCVYHDLTFDSERPLDVGMACYAQLLISNDSLRKLANYLG